MILDAGVLFTGAVVGPPGTTLKLADNITSTGTSNNIIDLAAGQTNTNNVALPPSATTPNVQPIRDIGIGDDPALKLLVQAIGPNWAGGTNLTVALQGSPDSGTGTPAGFVTYYSSSTVTLAQLNANARIMDMDMPRPPYNVPEPRFLQLAYTVTGPFTGTANFLVAGLVLDRMDQVYNASNNAIMGGYPAGVTVAN